MERGGAHGRETGHRTPKTFRGQAGLEQMLVFGMAIVFVIAAFVLSSSYFFEAIPAAEAHDAARLLAQEADYTGSLGRGTVRHVAIAFPAGTSGVNISGRRVVVRMESGGGVADFVSYASYNVTGGVRDPQGTQQLPVRTLESGVVQVGDLMLACFPNELVFSLGRGRNSSAAVSVVNAYVENITGISVSHTGPIGDMVAYTQPASGLVPGASSAALLTVAVPSGKAAGAYEGYIFCNSTNGGYDTTRIQINVG